MTENITKEALKELVGKGLTEAKFGKLDNANIFKHLLEYKGIPTKIEQKIGHATTIDTPAHVLLSKHFHVTGLKTSAHKVLGKFV
jgi:hypothetical protein